MKKILLIIILFCLAKVGMGQTYPVPQNLGRTPSTLVSTNSIRADEGIILGNNFNDTTAANALPYLKNYPWVIIATKNDSALWFRSKNANMWINLGGSGGGSAGTFWPLGYRQFPTIQAAFPPKIGTGAIGGADFTIGTNGIDRLIFRNDGINFSNVSTDSLLGRNVAGEIVLIPKSGGGGGLSTASNGLTAVGSDVQLGGTMNSTTTTMNLNRKKLNFASDGNDFLLLDARNSGSQDVLLRAYNPAGDNYGFYQGVANSTTANSGFTASFNDDERYAEINAIASADTATLIYDADSHTFIGELYATELANLPTQNRLLGVINSSGQFGNVTLGAGLSLSSGVLTNTGVVSTPTWQQTLTAGSTLSSNNAVSMGATTFTMTRTNSGWTNILDIGSKIDGHSQLIARNSSTDSCYLVANSEDVEAGAFSLTLGADLSARVFANSLGAFMQAVTYAGGNGTTLNLTKSGAFLAGNPLYGGESANDDLTISGTSNATRTSSFVNIQPSGGSVGIGTSTPAKIFHTVGTVRHASLGTASGDTSTYKPLGIDTNGDIIPITYWPGSGGGGGTPAGSNLDLQFKDGTSFGGTTGIQYKPGAMSLSITSPHTDTIPLVIKGTYFGNSDLTQWRNKANDAVLAYVNSGGYIKSTGSVVAWVGQGEQVSIGFSSILATAGIDFGVSSDAAIGRTAAGTLKARVDKWQFDGRALEKQGADVASAAGAIALGTDGNSFEITGTAAITLISNVGWQNGSKITFVFTSTASLTDGTANSGTDIGMELAGGTNFTASAGATITLCLMELGGTQRWREISRSVN